jgi:hypothetical protein
MLPNIKKNYRLKEYSIPNIFYHLFTPSLGILLSIFGGFQIFFFCFLLGAFISILFLDIDNCYEVITCRFNPTIGKISLQQKNIFSQGVLELSLNEIETVLVKSRSSSLLIKNRFGKNIPIDSQVYWLVLVLYSGEYRRLTYYETALYTNKQKIADYIIRLKENM